MSEVPLYAFSGQGVVVDHPQVPGTYICPTGVLHS